MVSPRSLLLLFVLATTLHSGTCQVLRAQAAASFRSDDCECQCIGLSFVNRYGQIEGNCRPSSSYTDRWCYVENRYRSVCRDKVSSHRFRGEYWSSWACRTPRRDSYECSIRGGRYDPYDPYRYRSGYVRGKR